jgi:hypothetical protein
MKRALTLATLARTTFTMRIPTLSSNLKKMV